MAERAYVIPEEPGLPHRLGRHVRHEEASRRFVAPRAAELRSVKHRHWIGHRDQARVGACTGFCGMAALGSKPYYRAGTAPTLTNALGFDLYRGATRRDPWAGSWEPDDTGSSGLACAKEMQARGLIVGYDWSFGGTASLHSLVLKPQLVGTWWKESMFDLRSDGVMEVTGADVGGHQWLVDGLDWERRRVRGLCCWGRWGYDGIGHFWMAVDDYVGLIDRQGDAMTLRR